MKEIQTEELIINTAKNIFFFKGNFHATTQEIADAAGVNRALIHYYFRTREQLLDAVLKDAMTKMHGRLYNISLSDLCFKDKIKEFITVFIEDGLETPYLENFVVHEFNRLDLSTMPIPHKDLIETCFKDFFDQMRKEMQKGTIVQMDPEQFMVNLVALCAYPISTRPLIQRTFDFSDEAYHQFIQRQKDVIYKLIFRD